ncbi:MAG: hypothetical protein WDA02_09675, partial [Saccharofermentanales bacterium]
DLPSLIVAFEASSYALKADVLAGNIKKRLSLITLQCFETAPFSLVTPGPTGHPVLMFNGNES